MKKAISSVVVIALCVSVLFQATSAVFEESVKVAGTSFSVASHVGESVPEGSGNSALKMLADLSGSPTGDNLVDTVAGPKFENIDKNWNESYPVKLHNLGDSQLNLVASAEYVSDPDVLRDDIFVEIVGWDDADADGTFDAGEETTSYGNDSILRLRNDTFALGTIDKDETRGFVLKFFGTGLTESNKDMSATYDFLITGVE